MTCDWREAEPVAQALKHGRRGRQPQRRKRLMPPLDDRFSARRGTYRVIYRVDDQARVATVVDIGHRRDVYRT